MSPVLWEFSKREENQNVGAEYGPCAKIQTEGLGTEAGSELRFQGRVGFGQEGVHVVVQVVKKDQDSGGGSGGGFREQQQDKLAGFGLQ